MDEDDSTCDAGFAVGNVDAGCGWGPLRPRVLQRFARVWTFIFFFGFAFTNGIQGSYIMSVVSTLERRFNFPSSMSGALLSIASVGYVVSAVFVSYFLGKRHPPRLFALCMLLTSICGQLYVIPHFLYGPGRYEVDALSTGENRTVDRGGAGQALCDMYEKDNQSARATAGRPATDGEASEGSNGCTTEEVVRAETEAEFVVPALVMFMLAEILQGVAGAPVWTVGISYIDDNTNAKLSAKLLGEIMVDADDALACRYIIYRLV